MTGLGEEARIGLYRTMVGIRAFEAKVKELVDNGSLGHVSLSAGGEAVAAGVSAHLGPCDQIGSTHRPLAHLLAKGVDPKRLMAELAGRAAGLNGGKAGPYHAFDPSVGALGANGIVGASVPMAAGYALAHQLEGDGGLAVAYFGEGASNQGGVQETFNLAACWRLPLVFVCENSSTPEEQVMLAHRINWPQLSVPEVSARAPGYGMPGGTYDGGDVELVYTVFGEAAERARRGDGPTLLEFRVRRLGVEGGPGCPLALYGERLRAEGVLTREVEEEIWAEARAGAQEAAQYALRSPQPEPMEAFQGVYAGE